MSFVEKGKMGEYELTSSNFAQILNQFLASPKFTRSQKLDWVARQNFPKRLQAKIDKTLKEKAEYTISQDHPLTPDWIKMKHLTNI